MFIGPKNLRIRYRLSLKLIFIFLDEITDAEINEWAARTIQTSFREYKRRQNWIKVQHANTFIEKTKKASIKKKTSSTSESELEAGNT